eukprot:gnl/TRDRNA2_/TRDRNA2_154394_c2_seq2.p2 gnl/TRDRNA2_/TRDRNA2_154394_c2~~gnl/TRDRNA2_/TRDRNA2_154394_c2_seq2.p2  ORF type:complete len:158 (+),score=42.44 gnl/TRDRNA2_/TRDRNA2_154394_c2_seq2:108-581(+)
MQAGTSAHAWPGVKPGKAALASRSVGVMLRKLDVEAAQVLAALRQNALDRVHDRGSWLQPSQSGSGYDASSSSLRSNEAKSSTGLEPNEEQLARFIHAYTEIMAAKSDAYEDSQKEQVEGLSLLNEMQEAADKKTTDDQELPAVQDADENKDQGLAA